MFVCTACEKVGKTVSLYAVVTVMDINSKEDDKYELLEEQGEVDHFCLPNGVEDVARRFKSELLKNVRDEPTAAIPSTYDATRTRYTQRFSDQDEKILFLSTIPSYPAMQNALYNIRREFIPPAPANQGDFDVNSEWFEMNGKNIVISDVIHSDGLRVVTFSTTENLEILCRSGTFGHPVFEVNF